MTDLQNGKIRDLERWSDKKLQFEMNMATVGEWRASLEAEAERRNLIDTGKIDGEYGRAARAKRRTVP